MYWVTHTNVIVWVISPNGVEVKTVFLPEVAVIDKVAKLVGSITTSSRPFDDKSAPGAAYLSHKAFFQIPRAKANTHCPARVSCHTALRSARRRGDRVVS